MVLVDSFAALFVSAVFLVAAVAKLRQVGTTAAGFSAIGIPGSLVVPVGAAELLAALALLVRPRVGAVMVLVLLAAFSLVLARSLIRSVRPGSSNPPSPVRCNCFGGGDGGGFVGLRSFLRNALLAACALAASGTKSLRLPGPAGLAFVGVVAVAGMVRQLIRLRRATGLLLPPIPRTR